MSITTVSRCRDVAATATVPEHVESSYIFHCGYVHRLLPLVFVSTADASHRMCVAGFATIDVDSKYRGRVGAAVC